MLKRVQNKLRSLGWADTAVFVGARVLSRLSFGTVRLVKYYFVAQPVAAAARAVSGNAGTTHYYMTHAEDAVITQAPRPIEVIRDRFAQRARCVAAARNDELAGFIWLCPQTYREDDVRCVYRWTPAAVAEWDFDVYISPPFRMGRLFVRLWEQAHALLRAQGVAWTLSRVDALNAESMAAHRKLGAQTLARGWFLRAGRYQLALLSMSPYWHFSGREDDRPEVCFDLAALAAAPSGRLGHRGG